MRKIYSYFLLIFLIFLNMSYSKTEIDKAFTKRSKSSANKKFAIYSPDIYKGREIRRNQLYNDLNCGGENISPELKWKNPPKGTKSFAIVMYTENSKKNKLWWNWVLYDIPSSVEELALDASNNKKLLPKGSIEAQNDYGEMGYGGPCPPLKSKYSYRIIIYALNVEKLGLIDGSTPTMVVLNLEKYKVGSAEIVSTYTGKYDNFLHKKPEDVKIIEDLDKKRKEEELSIEEIKEKLEKEKEKLAEEIEKKEKEIQEKEREIQEKEEKERKEKEKRGEIKKIKDEDKKTNSNKVYKIVKPTPIPSKSIKKSSVVKPIKKVSKVKTLDVELNKEDKKITSTQKIDTKPASKTEGKPTTSEVETKQKTNTLTIREKAENSTQPASTNISQKSTTQSKNTQLINQTPQPTIPTATQPSTTKPITSQLPTTTPANNTPTTPAVIPTTTPEIPTPSVPVPQSQQIPTALEPTTLTPQLENNNSDIDYFEVYESDLDFFEPLEEEITIEQNIQSQVPDLPTPTTPQQKTEEELKQEELSKIEQDILNMNF